MSDPPRTEASVLAEAFPPWLREDVATVKRLLPEATHSSLTGFVVRLDEFELKIPGRIYNPEPDSRAVAALSERQQVILHTVFTRHHDGFVRQRHLERAVESREPWVVPYVVRLIGEYVVEILAAIQEGLKEVDAPGSPARAIYGRFLAQNPTFLELTRQRVASYWNCYYRWQYARQSYPGFILIASLEAAAAEMRGVGT